MIARVSDVDGNELAQLAVLTRLDDTGRTWRQSLPLSLLDFAGRFVVVSFEAVTDKDHPTSFYLDDVSVEFVPLQEAGQLSIAFWNPRKICSIFGGGGSDQVLSVSGVLPVRVLAAQNHGIKALFLSLDGKLIAREHQHRLDFDLDTANLPDGPHLLAVEAVSMDGQRTTCPQPITTVQMLRNPSFESGLSPLDWTVSSLTMAAELDARSGGPVPAPVDGIYQARLLATERMKQVVYFPIDLQSATLSFFYRWATNRPTYGTDTVSLYLQYKPPLAPIVTLPPLVTFGNPLTSSSQWSLSAISLDQTTIETLRGKNVSIVFDARIPSATTTSNFYIDAAGIQLGSPNLSSQLVPTVHLVTSQTGNTFCGSPVVSATGSNSVTGTVDRLAVYYDVESEDALITSCETCNATPSVAWTPVGTEGCYKLIAVARNGGYTTRQMKDIFYSAANCAATGPQAPTATFTVRPPDGQSIAGKVQFTARADSNPQGCVLSTEILLDTISNVDTHVITSTEVIAFAWGPTVTVKWDSTAAHNGFHKFRIRTTTPTGSTWHGTQSGFDTDHGYSIDNPFCEHGDRCLTSLLDAYQVKCDDGDTGACLRLALCRATAGYRAMAFAETGPADITYSSAGAELAAGLDAMETMARSSGNSIFNSYPATALGLLAAVLDKRQAAVGSTLDAICPTSRYFDLAGVPCLTRVATVLVNVSDAYPDSELEQQGAEGCATGPQWGNTCAEERIGQAGAIRLARLMFPPPSHFPCPKGDADTFSLGALASSDTVYACRSTRLIGDANLVDAAESGLRLFNHGEENPPYAAAVISSYAVQDKILGMFGRSPTVAAKPLERIQGLFKWAASRSVDGEHYDPGHCLRLESAANALCPLPYEAISDTTDDYKCPKANCTKFEELIPSGDCPVWPNVVTCTNGYGTDTTRSSYVPCGDRCASSAGNLSRQPCWNPIADYMSSDLNSTPPLNAVNFSVEPRRSPAGYSDENEIFYYEIPVRLPAVLDLAGISLSSYCLSPPVPTGVTLTRTSEMLARLNWDRTPGAQGYLLYRRIAPVNDTLACPPTRPECGWELFSTVPHEAMPVACLVANDCTAIECSIIALGSADCQSEPSYQTRLDPSSPCHPSADPDYCPNVVLP